MCVYVCVYSLHLSLVVKSLEIEAVRGKEMGNHPGLITSHWYSKHHFSWKLSSSLALIFSLRLLMYVFSVFSLRENPPKHLI